MYPCVLIVCLFGCADSNQSTGAFSVGSSSIMIFDTLRVIAHSYGSINIILLLLFAAVLIHHCLLPLKMCILRVSVSENTMIHRPDKTRVQLPSALRNARAPRQKYFVQQQIFVHHQRSFCVPNKAYSRRERPRRAT